MKTFSIIFPDDFENYAWEVEAKGWFNDVVVEVDGERFRIAFYDIARLSQDIEYELSVKAAFFEKNIVALKFVNRESIERAIEFIAASDGFARMKPEE